MKKFLLLFALIISGMGLFAQDAASATKVTDDDYFWIEEENITQTSASFIIHSIYDDFFIVKFTRRMNLIVLNGIMMCITLQ